MVFTQNIQFDQMRSLEETQKICAEHPECKDCPLLTREIQAQNAIVICETGRLKNQNKQKEEGESNYEESKQN